MHARLVSLIACALILAFPLSTNAGEKKDPEKDEQLDQVIAEEDIESEDDLLAEFDLLMEEEIVFSAAKHQQYIAESPSAVTVITREMIESTHCPNVACLLRQVPEVDVRWVISSYAVVGARAPRKTIVAPARMR